jgi:Cu+-exporting ATPase
MNRKESLKITGMSCAACAARIEKGLCKLEGVKQANVNFAIEKATVEYDDAAVSPDKFEETIQKLGYGIIKEAAKQDNRVELKISGMSCAACAARIEKGLNKLEGVNSANVNFAMERATVEYDDQMINAQKFDEVVSKLG